MDRESLEAFDARWSARLSLAEGRPTLRRLAILLAHSGDSWFWLLGLVVLAIAGDPDARSWAFRVGGSILALALVVFAIKLTVRRQRPEGEWGGIYRKSDPHSFPSGHAARAIMLAVLALGWGPGWLAALLVPWAPLVGLARIAMGLHFPTDVLAGAAVGLVAGVLALLIL